MRFRLAVGGRAGRELDIDAFAGRAVFERVLDQVLEQPDELVAVAEDQERIARLDIDADTAVARQRLQAVDHLADDRHQIDRLIGAAVRVELDARQRQQVVDQPRHAERLLLHDGEKALARLGVVARRTLQRLDKAEQRCERRAQLVAGIGDEVGAHLLDAPQRREIVKRQQHQVGPVQAGLALDRHDDRLEPAVERAALGIGDALLLAARRGAANGLDQFGHAQSERHRLAQPQRRRQRAGVLVERQHAAVTVERAHRNGQAGDHGAKRIVGAHGDGDRLRQAIVLVAAA